MLFVLFVLGFCVGVFGCLFVILAAFFHAQSRLDALILRKTLKHASYSAVAKEAAKLLPVKVESLCKVACFDDDVTGAVIACRVVLYSNTAYFYRIDRLDERPDHRKVVAQEQLMGAINASCVLASSQHISKYHRHRNKNSRFSALRGKCLVLSAREAAPLFVEDPIARFHRRLQRHSLPTAVLPLGDGASRAAAIAAAAACGTGAVPVLGKDKSSCGNVTGGDVGCSSDGVAHAHATASHHHGSTGNYSDSLTSNHGDVNGGDDKNDDDDDDDDEDAYGGFDMQLPVSSSSSLSTSTARTCAPPCGRCHTRLCHCRGSGGVHNGGGGGNSNKNNDNDDSGCATAPLSRWRRIAIKFPTLRVHERWLTLLQSTTQTVQWADFLRHLPQLDVLNLLVARLFFENTRTSSLHDFLERKLQAKLANVSKTLPRHFRGNITLANLLIGGEIPLLTHFSEGTVTPTGDLEFDFDVLYRGGLVLSICFDIRYRRIRLPKVIFHVKVLELAGRMRFSIAPPPTNKFWLSGPKPPQLRLDFSQETVSREGVLSVLVSMIPDMSEFMTNVVKVLLFEDMVLPNYDDFPWPVLSESSSDEDVTSHDEDDEHDDDDDDDKDDEEEEGATVTSASSTDSLSPSSSSQRHRRHRRRRRRRHRQHRHRRRRQHEDAPNTYTAHKDSDEDSHGVVTLPLTAQQTAVPAALPLQTHDTSDKGSTQRWLQQQQQQPPQTSHSASSETNTTGSRHEDEMGGRASRTTASSPSLSRERVASLVRDSFGTRPTVRIMAADAMADVDAHKASYTSDTAAGTRTRNSCHACLTTTPTGRNTTGTVEDADAMHATGAASAATRVGTMGRAYAASATATSARAWSIDSDTATTSIEATMSRQTTRSSDTSRQPNTLYTARDSITQTPERHTIVTLASSPQCSGREEASDPFGLHASLDRALRQVEEQLQDNGLARAATRRDTCKANNSGNNGNNRQAKGSCNADNDYNMPGTHTDANATQQQTETNEGCATAPALHTRLQQQHVTQNAQSTTRHLTQAPQSDGKGKLRNWFRNIGRKRR